MDVELDRAVEAATRWVLAEHSDWKVDRVELVADETDRRVLRVWYRRALPSRPAPYKVVSVDRSTQRVAEIDVKSQPQYAVRGHK